MNWTVISCVAMCCVTAIIISESWMDSLDRFNLRKENRKLGYPPDHGY